jgi:RND family efflux transporter MFP subunit
MMRALLVILLLLGAPLSACSRGPAAAGAPAPRPALDLQAPHSATVPASRPTFSPAAAPAGAPAAAPLAPNREAGTFIGVLLARQSVTVAAESDGRIASVAVRVGDSVRRGQELANLATEDLVQERAMEQAALAGARSEASRAALELERAVDKSKRRDLHPELYPEEEIVSAHTTVKEATAALDTARSHVTQETAHLRQLDARLTHAVLRAPIDGRVAQRFLDPGAQIHPGSAVLRLISAHDFLLRFAVGPEQAHRLRRGLPVAMRLDALPVTLAGRITQVAPEIDAASQMLFVEAELAIPPAVAPRLQDGLVGRVSLPAAAAPTG